MLHPTPPTEAPTLAPDIAAESTASPVASAVVPDENEVSEEKSGLSDTLETVGGVIVGALDILSLFD